VGKLVDSYGGVYEGRFKGGKFHGHGTYFNDFSEYTGGWANGKKEGKGI